MSLSSWLCAIARSLGERRVALDVALGPSELRLRLGELRARLREHRLERPRVDLEEHLALADRRAFLISSA